MAKPNTISDDEWRRLQAAAEKANPQLGGFSAEAVKARQQSKQQRDRARDN